MEIPSPPMDLPSGRRSIFGIVDQIVETDQRSPTGAVTERLSCGGQLAVKGHKLTQGA
jgi:hypothetical protein